MMLFNNWLLSIFFILAAFIVAAQDTQKQTTETDTVYIQKDPVILRKTVVYDKKTYRKWLLDFFINMSYASNTTTYCSCDSSFNVIYRKGFSNKISYGLGVNLSRQYNKFIFTGSLQLIALRSQLSYNNTSNNSTYGYLNSSLLAGYKIGNHRFAVIPAGGIVLSTLISGSGKSLSPSDLSWVHTSSSYYYRNTIDIAGRIKAQYSFLENKLLYIEGYVLHDMQNITKKSAPFGLKRTLIGINAGITFLLK